MRALVLVALASLCSNCLAADAPRAEDARAAPPAKAAFDHDYAAWSAFLRAHVRGDRFDYGAAKKERKALDAFVASLESVDASTFERWEKAQRYAFWINAYNAYTVRRVVDSYPIASIKDLGDDKVSVWDRDLIPLGALAPDLKKPKLSLNDVENLILRPRFEDARVHAAINCASIGCPPLRPEAFTAAKLDAQLDEQVKAWLGDPTRNRIDAAAQKLELSKVFEWFKADFEREAGSAQAWIARYRPDDAKWLGTKKKLDVTFLEYDWALNAPK